MDKIGDLIYIKTKSQILKDKRYSIEAIGDFIKYKGPPSNLYIVPDMSIYFGKVLKIDGFYDGFITILRNKNHPHSLGNFWRWPKGSYINLSNERHRYKFLKTLYG